MIHLYIKHTLLTALFAILILSAPSCFYQVYDDKIDIVEQQSVWQYLNVYSIYQDRLPEECGDNSPKDLFDIIDDNLGGARYTGYVNGWAGGRAGVLSASQANSDNMLKITDSTVYLRIPDFLDSALEKFNACRSDLERFSNIVIDLRDNGGGYLYATDSIIGEFLPYGTEYISTRHRAYDNKNLKGITVDWEKSKNRKTNPRLTNRKISVLINGHSASASEIMASALKDRANAHLLGVAPTYGKGIGQVIIPRSGRQTLSITFMQIKGVSDRTGYYHEKGIAPDTIPDFLKKEAEDSCLLVEIKDTVTSATRYVSEKDTEDTTIFTPATVITRLLVDQSLYSAVKLMEPSAPGEKILEAALKIRNSSAMRMRKKQGAGTEPIGVYVVTEPDPLE